jgi:hypothetical protein
MAKRFRSIENIANNLNPPARFSGEAWGKSQPE